LLMENTHDTISNCSFTDNPEIMRSCDDSNDGDGIIIEDKHFIKIRNPRKWEIVVVIMIILVIVVCPIICFVHAVVRRP
jgi:hypothetical protein